LKRAASEAEAHEKQMAHEIGSVKNVMTNNMKRSTIRSLNRHRRRKQTHRTKMSRVVCHIKGGFDIKDPS
jgi:hypothetical protein